MCNEITTDILVIGGGAAGMKAAITSAQRGKKIILLSKASLSKTGVTPVAGEGIEAAVNPDDSVTMHFNDTIKAGRGLADQDLVRELTVDSIDQIYELKKYGVCFKEKEDGTFVTSMRPGQSCPRNLFIKGGGWGLTKILLKNIVQLSNIKIIDNAIVIRFLIKHNRVVGVVYLNVNNSHIVVIQTKAIILASGGYQQLWSFSDTPSDVTGDILTLAYQIGARLIDLEMVLYYPATIIAPLAAKGCMVQYEYILNPDILDGRVLNGQGKEFIFDFPDRDKFIKAICDEVKQGTASPHGGCFIDFSTSRYTFEELTQKLLKWVYQFKNLKQVGIDLRTDKIEIAPAIHYCLGGIKINAMGKTNVNGLFAAGEVSGNLHGANRLSGNSLLETQVFGRIAGISASEYVDTVTFVSHNIDKYVLKEYQKINYWQQKKTKGIRPCTLKLELQSIMSMYVGLNRDGSSLNKGLNIVRKLQNQIDNLVVVPQRRYCYELREAYEVRGMINLAELIILSALQRKETRGHHFRMDYPQTSKIPYHTFVQLRNGRKTVELLNVIK